MSPAALPVPARGRWLMWGIPAAIFFIAFLHRVVPGIVAKDIHHQLDRRAAARSQAAPRGGYS